MPISEHRFYAQRLLLLLTLILGVRLAVAALLPLSPQEAYYWVFSLHPAWSYFDHPPLTAAVIGLFTTLLGDQALAVRLGALLFSLGFSLLAYLVGKDLFGPRVGFWTGLISTLLPSYAITALIITPDSPLVFFWTLSYLPDPEGGSRKPPRLPPFIRSFPGTGPLIQIHGRIFSSFPAPILSVYPGPAAPLETLGALRGLGPGGRWFFPRSSGGMPGTTGPLLPFNPPNGLGSWANSLRPTWAPFWPPRWGSSAPLVFAGMAVPLGLGLKRFFRRKSWQENYLLSLSLPMIGLFTLVATREWVKMNWLIPAYLPLILLMLGYYRERIFAWSWVYRGIAAWTWVTVGLFFILLHLWPFVPQIKVSGSMDTLTGWRELAIYLESVRIKMPRPQDTFILAWGHKTAAELEYHLQSRVPVVAQTALGKKALAYDYWFDPTPLKGKDALFVWSELENFPDEGSGLLEQFFLHVEKAEPFTVYRGRHPLRTFRIFRCTGYRGFYYKKP